MGYPYGQPGQPGYGQQPSFGYPPQQPARGGTGITAGVLALVAGGLNAVGATVVVAIDSKVHGSGKVPFAAIEAGFIALVLIVGGILLLCRLTIGRVMVLLGCALALVDMSIGVVMSATLGVLSPTSVLGFALILPTTVLAAVGSTGRWIAERRRPQVPPPYGQPVQPYAQPVSDGQPVQPSATPYAQPAPFGQPAPHGQPDPYQQPGQYQQPQPPYPYQ
ncbi:hypothetical protein [Nocardia sp. NPDC049707]|uniref:hypothetical protein n=1 Tax=Nocardia sp. NPDC049707 TaxID=3154735 RepID=UPI00344277F0